ncbi:hypothetical protein WJX74_008971 [Apatococcus lobatus]|uniref:PDZ domain-containing protein n=1 Tax=Apatococcus lobatus TaxID=904363 RepID=A0AAW1S2K9_9CHLO
MLTKALQTSQATLYPAKGVREPCARCRAQRESEGPAAQPQHTTRRQLHQALASALLLSAAPAAPCIAQPAAVQEALPSIVPRGPLSDREQAIINVFDQTTYSVVNVFDLTLQANSRAQASNVETPEGNGTGFVWDKEGHIVTNYHVLANVLRTLPKNQLQRNPRVARITLLGTDGFQNSYEAIFIGGDRSRDVAVVKIGADQDALQPVTVGDSSTVRVGQQCLAIGNPFGFDHTLTTGVVSGVGREIQSPLGITIGGGIQTDASINPGNSGGPLLDSKGRVIGVNTAIFTQSGTSAGVGFAIPIDSISKAVPQLIEYGRIIRPTLNLTLATDQVARALKVQRGAVIQGIAPNSAAAKAGLLTTRRGLTGIVPGDVIIGLEDRKVTRAGDLVSALDDFSIGDTVSLTVQRGVGQQQGPEELKIPIQLEEATS